MRLFGKPWRKIGDSCRIRRSRWRSSYRCFSNELRSCLQLKAFQHEHTLSEVRPLDLVHSHGVFTNDPCAAGLEQCDSSALLPSAVIHELAALPHLDDTGVYEANDSTLRAFANESPCTPVTPCYRAAGPCLATDPWAKICSLGPGLYTYPPARIALRMLEAFENLGPV